MGVIGYGKRIDSVIQRHFRKLAPDLRVTDIVDPDEEGVRRRLAECDRADARFHPDIKSLLRDGKVDAVAIGTRCNLHAPYAAQVAATDLPLFLEKPVAVSMPQLVALARAFEKSRCQVVVSFPLRISPLCTLARRYLDAQAVGRPQHILAVNYVPNGLIYYTSAYRDYKITQGLFLQKATHDFDYMCHLMNAPIKRVAAMASFGRVYGGRKKAGLRCSACRETAVCLESPENLSRHDFNHPTGDHWCAFSRDLGTPATGMLEDHSSALLEFANGVQGVYTQVFYARRDAAARGAIISGYLGTLRFDWHANTLWRIRHHEPFSDTIKGDEAASNSGGDMELARDFIGLIEGRIVRSRTPIETGIHSASVCLAARESARRGCFLSVRQF